MALVKAIASMFESYLEKSTIESTYHTCFYARKPPLVSIRKYLERLWDYMNCSEECFVLALIYIERLTSIETELPVNSLSIHRLVLIALAIAAKFFDDKYYKNSYYAKVGGVSLEEFNCLEKSFLLIIDFTLFVSTQQYDKYHIELLRHFGEDHYN